MPRRPKGKLTLHVRQMQSSGGWWWLILQRGERALELIDTAPNQHAARSLARTLADAHGWEVAK